MDVKRPKKWKIEIWEEDGKWHEKYIELFPDCDEIREAMDFSIGAIRLMLSKTGLIDVDIKEIRTEGMIGILITMSANSLVPIANQLLSEFVIMSEIGDITLRDMFMILIQSFIYREKEALDNERLSRNLKNELKKINEKNKE